jgi:WXXGXW repeat (2 copies)
MMKRTLYTFLATAAISTTAMIAPALVTPAAAQVGVNLNIGIPMPAPVFEAVPAPRPGYLWQAGYWRGEGEHRYWERGRWQEHRFAEHRFEERRGWGEHGHYYR